MALFAGDVYECHNTQKPKEKLVIKYTTPKYRKDFDTECRAYKKLSGLPCIPRLLRTGIAQGRCFLVIERMPCTLEEYHDDGPIPKTTQFIAKLTYDLVSPSVLHRALRLTGDRAEVESYAVYSSGRNRPRRHQARQHRAPVQEITCPPLHLRLWRGQPVGSGGRSTSSSPRLHDRHGCFRKCECTRGRRCVLLRLEYCCLTQVTKPVQAPSPRDDIISLVYTLIDVFADNLPWRWEMGFLSLSKLTRRAELRSIIRIKKKATAGLHGTVPAEVLDLLDHASSLNFGDIPDYDRFLGIFQQLAATTNSPSL